MKRFIITIAITVIPVVILGQFCELSRGEKIYEKCPHSFIYTWRNYDSLFNAGKYLESIAWNTAQKTEDEAQSEYRIAVSFVKLGMKDSAYKHLNDYIDASNDDRIILVDKLWNPLKTDTLQWNKLVSKIENLYLKDLGSNVNKVLALELFYLGILDQKYRTNLIGFDSVDWNDTVNRILMKQENNFLITRFEEIIQDYGFPTLSLVGYLGSASSFFLLQHSPYLEKYYPLIKRCYQNNEILPIHYAMVTDRYLMHRNRKQIYGSQLIWSSHKTEKKYPGKTILWPVKDFKNVNQRRKEMGFPTTVEENTKRFHNGYIPPEYYEGKGSVRWVR
jgi:hypothetical protein